MVSDTGISKSDIMLVRFELFPLLVKLLFAVSPYVSAGLVLVETIGSMPVQNTTLAIGFQIAMLDISWTDESNVCVVLPSSFNYLVLFGSGVNR